MKSTGLLLFAWALLSCVVALLVSGPALAQDGPVSKAGDVFLERGILGALVVVLAGVVVFLFRRLEQRNEIVLSWATKTSESLVNVTAVLARAETAMSRSADTLSRADGSLARVEQRLDKGT